MLEMLLFQLAVKGLGYWDCLWIRVSGFNWLLRV